MNQSIYKDGYCGLLNQVIAANESILSQFKEQSFFITGGTGMLLSCLVDILLSLRSFNGKLVLLVRSKERALQRFERFNDDHRLLFVESFDDEPSGFPKKIDYVIHGASPADPGTFLIDPVATMDANILMTKQAIGKALEWNSRFLFMSSVEMYGTVSAESIKETTIGGVDTLNPRSCYNESKRAAETYCASYGYKYGLDFLVARISRAFGPTSKAGDMKVLTQFIECAATGKDIVLKSDGNQRYSFTFVTDVATALLYILKHGTSKEAYNVAADFEGMSLSDVAKIIAEMASINVVFALPDKYEQSAHSNIANAVQDNSKLKSLGWRQSFTLKEAICSFIKITRQHNGKTN